MLGGLGEASFGLDGTMALKVDIVVRVTDCPEYQLSHVSLSTRIKY